MPIVNFLPHALDKDQTCPPRRSKRGSQGRPSIQELLVNTCLSGPPYLLLVSSWRVQKTTDTSYGNSVKKQSLLGQSVSICKSLLVAPLLLCAVVRKCFIVRLSERRPWFPGQSHRDYVPAQPVWIAVSARFGKFEPPKGPRIAGCRKQLFGFLSISDHPDSFAGTARACK